MKVGNDYTNKALQLRNLWSRNASCAGLDQNLEYAYSLELNPLFTNPQPDGERYFYHSDHLGSSAYITTENGYATQFLAYMPYGETLSEQQNSTSYYSPFKFSAKEKDPETGYSYFGARYYSPELSVWLSIDPLSDKYPSLSPYNYCALNPIMLVDPDGREIDIYDNKGKYVKTIPDGKKEVSAVLARAEDLNGTDEDIIKNGTQFTYNDPSVDRDLTKNQGYTVQIADLKQVGKDILKSGSASNSIKPGTAGLFSSLAFALKEGRKDGSLDFYSNAQESTPARTLSIVTDKFGMSVAYNPHDMGNFMFGVATNLIGFPTSWAQFGGHFNNAFFGRSDSNVPWTLLDSQADQRAIENGSNFGIRPQVSIR